jgi:hypothetical protein
MTEASAQPQAPSEQAPARAGRGRIVLARTLTVIGILLVVVTILANFVKRTALDESHFRDSARMIVADPTIRDQLALTMVDALYSNVDVQSALADRLPKDLKGLRRSPAPRAPRRTRRRRPCSSGPASRSLRRRGPHAAAARRSPRPGHLDSSNSIGARPPRSC